MKKQERDFYYEVLKYGHEHSEQGFTIDQLREDLSIKRDTVQSIMFESEIAQMFKSSGKAVTDDHGNVIANLFFLRLEAYYRYIEILELREARRFAKTATWLSAAAIIIALSSLLISWITNFPPWPTA